ncbi:hypothetical protein COF81_29145 [Bacillus pseudomycoides]|uniref:Lipoprotein n=1 Tax=Bacillus pseudomycoides TaxID=64104 RepID=A0ABD6T2H1_9BACI|nr:hypothetical protein COF81_29145 [Bacillus pseudomycoides]
MNKGKGLLLPLLLATLLSACQQNDKEEAKVMDTIMETVDEKDFLSASMSDTPRTVDLEIADTGVPPAFRKKTTLRACKILYNFPDNPVTNKQPKNAP